MRKHGPDDLKRKWLMLNVYCRFDPDDPPDDPPTKQFKTVKNEDPRYSL